MKKLVLAGIGLFMMAGFLPAKSNDVMTENNVAFGCIFITCLEMTVCDESLGDADFAASISDNIEEVICGES